MVGKKPLCWVYLLEVKASEPIVRPWKPPRKPMKRGRPVTYRASFRAPSTLSVPDWARNVITGSPIGASSLSRSERRTEPSCQ